MSPSKDQKEKESRTAIDATGQDPRSRAGQRAVSGWGERSLNCIGRRGACEGENAERTKAGAQNKGGGGGGGRDFLWDKKKET
eukprot:759579-Hanusia_phi.AAC.2